MADNSSLPVASGNETFANDDIGGVKYPRPKINWGPDGTANDVDVASGKPLPIQLRESGGTEISPSRERWKAGAGVGFTWTDATTTASLNSLANGSCLLGTVSIANQTALDKYMDVDVVLASAAFTGAGINISVHLYPLSSDASTYGDGKFGSAAAGPCAYPPVAVIPLVAATQAQTGQVTGIVIPPGTYRLVICNNGGVALAASGNTLKYRTYN